MKKNQSRKDILDKQLFTAAQAGKFTVHSKLKLYKSEIKKLRRDGFSVMPKAESNKPVNCEISWSSPFDGKLPILVYSYVVHLTNTPPKEELNLAQELYVIAYRKINE